MFAEITFTLPDLQQSVGDDVLRASGASSALSYELSHFSPRSSFFGKGGGGINL